MKIAKEMKELSLKNSKIVNHLEITIAPLIEQTAKQGKTWLRIKTDEFPSEYNRSTIIDEVMEYMKKFDYDVSCTSDYKNITIQW